MKKLLIGLGLFLIPSISHGFVIKYVQMSTVPVATIQPGTSNYWFYVASGTSRALATSTFTVLNSTSTGDFVLNKSTLSFTSAFTRGTLTDFSTRTYQQAMLSGLKTENSTTTFNGGEFSGTRNDNSTTTLLGASFLGTKTDNSTNTYTGSNNFQNGIVVSTTPGISRSVFDTGTSSISIRSVLNVSTASGQGIALQVNNSSISLNASSYIMGTNIVDNAPSGYYGEYMSSSTAGVAIQVSTTNMWSDPTSLTLTPGDWDISAQFRFSLGTGTVQACNGAVTTTAGNSGAGQISGDNEGAVVPPTASGGNTLTLVGIRASIAVTTTYYGKALCTYTSGWPTVRQRMSARRIR